MKVEVPVEEVRISEATSRMVESGWKVSESSPGVVKAKKDIGQSEYPVRLSTTWRITITQDSITAEVPAFADSNYARKRMLDTVSNLFDVEVDNQIDLLQGLQEEGEL